MWVSPLRAETRWVKNSIAQPNHHLSTNFCRPSPARASGFFRVFRRKKSGGLQGKRRGPTEVGPGAPVAPLASRPCGGAGTCRRRRPGRRGARRASSRLQEAPGVGVGGAPAILPRSPGRWNGFAFGDPGREALGACGGGGGRGGSRRGASLIGLSVPPGTRRFYKAATVAGRSQATLLTPRSAPLAQHARPPAPTMATLQQLVGRWRLVESKGFDEYMKEVGVGMALRKVGAMAKPDCIISSDGKNLTIKTESTLKTTQFSCNLGEKFEETTADGRKTQTVCTFTNGALVQHQEWDGKESTITRKLEDGKLVVECVMNNVTCTRVYEKVE
uniref:Fatty acid binding protein 5 n=1 Tax=Felis catus TaxID=9685 RepID=A0ABI7W789_FELCA